jgi:hypothetical protein
MDWLLKNAPGFGALTEDERQAIAEFSLLWSLFEARVLDTRATAQRIYTAVRQWRDEGSLDPAAYDPELAYFKSRYFDGNDFTHHFHHLHLHPANKPGRVRAVIDGTNDDPCDCVAVVHNIALRFRNNLFHGIKWQYQLQGQLENFRTAGRVLIKTLKRHGNLGGD